MEIFAIRNKLDKTNKDIAYLFYYKKSKKFYIELNDSLNEWELPFIFDHFLKNGENTINAYWSKKWVDERIIPSNRQNIGQILKDNNLNEYDEYKLLLLTNGECSQDSFYIKKISLNNISQAVLMRNKQKIDDVLALNNNCFLVFFRDNKIKKYKLNDLIKNDPRFKQVLLNDELFKKIYVETGGQGICFTPDLCIGASTLYKNGQLIDLELDDFISYLNNNIVDSNEASKILNCSRQNIDDLVKKNTLKPIKSSNKYRLYLKNDINQMKW